MIDDNEDLEFDSNYILEKIKLERVSEEREALVLDVSTQRFLIKGTNPLSCSFFDANYIKDDIIYSSFAEEENDEI
jgi:hypothetical protein